MKKSEWQRTSGPNTQGSTHCEGVRTKLPAVFDPEEALKPGAPVVHERWKNNIAGIVDFRFNCGDLQKALAESDYVVEFSGRNSRQKQAHLRPDMAVACCWDDSGRLTIWSPNQNAYLAKRTLARRVLGIAEGDARWITTTVGGSPQFHKTEGQKESKPR